MIRLTALAAAAAACLAIIAPQPAEAGAALDAIKQRGTLRCGVQGPGNPGFGTADSQGRWVGFNVEICRAVAITIFNDPNKVEFVPVTSQSRFPALAAGEVDMLSNNSTWTLTRDSNVNRFNFPAIVFFDGQAMMVNRRLGVTSARGLNGATVCVQPGTTTEMNLADYFRQHNMRFTPVVIADLDELRRAYDSGRCDVFTNDFAALAAQRTLLTNPRDHVILPERISKEPLSPVVRQGDEELTNIVAWTVFGLIDAEEFGITRANVAQRAASDTDPRVKRLLGVEGNMGESLGAANGQYMRTILAAFGNYGEIFERHLGTDTPLGLERGQNNIWTKGGLLYAPPAR
ncbi:amino acid ABC transporter substrate-binding protein [Paracraurococcus ruber]|uniref:Amino acid ABC transporter substrate-binding protein n=1 Tax=Paracraurococcus ruber TaxID=77675 RepID=A0ABS1D5Q6_9PROT|nr:amino acid ABC transporter substrate-binding protein [Paracraurococcus ruber]MBK1661810.1 amino acid ABC transporter substrate-binding protein [Paracraurococcus ruber]TDG14569.1 amino acid ABC transporter substrate-binding protein [Paracraurococcus ruber]